MIWVEGKSPGSKTPTFEPFGFEPDLNESGGDLFRVRHLISKLVFESVRDFQLRERDGAFKVLTSEALAEGLKRGKIGRAREEMQTVDLDEATGQALQAFEDGLFLIFVDGEEKRGLEELVTLLQNTRVTLIRLTALSGR